MRSLVIIVTLVTLFPLSPCPSVLLHAQDCDNLNWDANITYQANQLEGGWRTSSEIVSDALLPLTIGTPILLYTYGMLNVNAFGGDQEVWRYSAESGLQLGVTMGVTYGLTVLMKAVVGRERPYIAHPDCINGFSSEVDGSMPSGHSAGSAAFATTLSLRYPKWYVIGPTVLYALYTGFSRLNLGVHYLTDVLAGYALGSGVALLVHVLNDELFNLADPILPDRPNTSAFAPLHTPILSYSISF